MVLVTSGAFRLRAAALLGVGALALHQGRYFVGYGEDAGRALAAHGHSYLTLATTLVVLACVVALGAFLASIARGGEERSSGRPALWRVAAVAATALLAIYTLQEGLEALAAGHPTGPGGIWGAGGWSAVPLAMAIGLVVALLLRGAEAVLARVARRRGRLLPRSRAIAVRPPLRVPKVQLGRLARHLAGRAPPLLRP